MKFINRIVLFLMLFLPLVAFSQFEELKFGTDSTLEIVTWNIEHFPKNNQITIDYVSQIIQAMDVDIVAVQEITSKAQLDLLTEYLDGWSSFYAYNQYAALGYIYRTSLFDNTSFFEIYTNNSREFPRSPLVMEFDYLGQKFAIINNHFKCCGNQLLDINDEWDEETRRLDACLLIDEYINTNYPNDNVVVVGDLNDILTDVPQNNVFQIFINNPSEYLFADMAIAEGDDANWSYPTWPSHLDHILISNELIDDFANPESTIKTIKVEEAFDQGWSEYDENVSDHRPVGIMLKTEDYTGISTTASLNNKILVYPNPLSESVNFSFPNTTTVSSLQIFSVQGTLVFETQISINRYGFSMDFSDFEKGVYFVKITINNSRSMVSRFVKTR